MSNNILDGFKFFKTSSWVIEQKSIETNADSTERANTIISKIALDPIWPLAPSGGVLRKNKPEIGFLGVDYL